VHVPSIPRYMCNACNQTHHNQSDIRAHQLWHKLSKTPYKCPLCDTSVANAYAFARHMREYISIRRNFQLLCEITFNLQGDTFMLSSLKI